MSVTTAPARRSTTIVPRSLSAGFVHASNTCVLAAVAVALLTLPGDRLSIVMTVLPLSLPPFAWVPVQSSIWAVSA